jgi:hypothetical protein
MSTAHPHNHHQRRPDWAMHKHQTQLDPRPFFIERGSTVRVRQRALRKCQQMAFFVARPHYTGVLSDPQPVPRICPQGSKLTLFLA